MTKGFVGGAAGEEAHGKKAAPARRQEQEFQVSGGRRLNLNLLGCVVTCGAFQASLSTLPNAFSTPSFSVTPTP